jgi:hypothetical protein
VKRPPTFVRSEIYMNLYGVCAPDDAEPEPEPELEPQPATSATPIAMAATALTELRWAGLRPLDLG